MLLLLNSCFCGKSLTQFSSTIILPVIPYKYKYNKNEIVCEECKIKNKCSCGKRKLKNNNKCIECDNLSVCNFVIYGSKCIKMKKKNESCCESCLIVQDYMIDLR